MDWRRGCNSGWITNGLALHSQEVSETPILSQKEISQGLPPSLKVEIPCATAADEIDERSPLATQRTHRLVTLGLSDGNGSIWVPLRLYWPEFDPNDICIAPNLLCPWQTSEYYFLGCKKNLTNLENRFEIVSFSLFFLMFDSIRK